MTLREKAKARAAAMRNAATGNLTDADMAMMSDEDMRIVMGVIDRALAEARSGRKPTAVGQQRQRELLHKATRGELRMSALTDAELHQISITPGLADEIMEAMP
jgi:hypothetical protein